MYMLEKTYSASTIILLLVLTRRKNFYCVESNYYKGALVANAEVVLVIGSRTMALPKTKLVNGIRAPLIFPSENVCSAPNYQPDDSDTFVVTYPKSGTTWMTYILYLIRENCPTDDFRLSDFIPFLEKYGADEAKSFANPRVIKTHLPFDRLQWNDKAKYIFLVRNPFDCCVSCYYHCKKFGCFEFKDGIFDDFFEGFLNGEIFVESYFRHLQSLYNERNRPNVLFLTFEEMKERTRDVILRVASFLGGEYQRKVDDPVFLDRVVEMSSFASMQNLELAFFPDGGNEIPFVRKGMVGDYRNHFSEEQTRRLTNRLVESCGSFDVLELWRKHGIPCGTD